MVTKKILLTVCYFVFTPLFIVFTFLYYSGTIVPDTAVRVSQRASDNLPSEVLAVEQTTLPAVLGAYTLADAIPVVVSKYLDHYQSKIPPETIVQYANEYGVDPRLIVAIAQQESNLGKKMPEECHNAWGYGIHARGTLCFESWEEGIKTVTRGIAEKYCQKGLCDDPCVMMKKYTPSSNGSWCYGVNQFLEEMRSGNF